MGEKIKEPVVIFLGRTGSGKSSTVSILLGSNPVNGELLNSDTLTPKTSSGFESKTVNITLYKNDHDVNKWVYADTGGFGDTRGGEHQLWIKHTFSSFFSMVREIKAIVIMLNASYFDERATLFEKLARDVYDLSKGNDHFYNNIIFCITGKLDDDPTKQVQEKCEQLKVALNKKIEGRQSVDQPEEQSEEQLNACKTLLLAQSLLRTHKESHEQEEKLAAAFHIPHHTDKSSCRKIREIITNKIKNMKSITHENLYIPEDTSHTIQTILSSLAIEKSQTIKRKLAALNGLINITESKKSQLDSANKDWARHKRDLLTKLANDEIAAKNEIIQTNKKIKHLRGSTILQCYKRERIYKANFPSNIFTKALNWLSSTHDVTYTYTYSSGEPFHSFEIDRKDNINILKIDELSNIPEKASLTIKLKANKLLDLNINIMMEENKLPATKEKIKSLQSEVSDINEKLNKIQTNTDLLNVVSSHKDLTDFITKEGESFKESLANIENELKMPLNKSENHTESDFIDKLYEHLLSLKNKKLFPAPNLPLTCEENINDFIDSYASLQQAYGNQQLKNLPTFSSIINHTAGARRNPDVNLPGPVTLAEKTSYKTAQLYNQLAHILKIYAFDQARNHLPELGISMISHPFFTLILTLGRPTTRRPLLAAMLPSAGVFLIAHALINWARKKEMELTDSIRSFTHYIKFCNTILMSQCIDSKETLERCLNTLSDNFNVDVKADMRVNIEKLLEFRGVVVNKLLSLGFCG